MFFVYSTASLAGVVPVGTEQAESEAMKQQVARLEQDNDMLKNESSGLYLKGASGLCEVPGLVRSTTPRLHVSRCVCAFYSEESGKADEERILPY